MAIITTKLQLKGCIDLERAAQRLPSAQTPAMAPGLGILHDDRLLDVYGKTYMEVWENPHSTEDWARVHSTHLI